MVKTIQMKLDVNKTTVNSELIRIRQGDKNSTKLEVEVLYDGQPYSLTGLSATFNATKPDGKVVVENATTSENKIIYVLNSQVGAISGTISKAYFSIKNTSGVEIDSTSNFRIDVLTGTDVSAGSSDYVDSLESTRLKAQNLLTQIDDSIAAVDGVVAQINTLGQQASNTLKEKLEGLSTQATTGVNDIKAQLQELISSKIASIQSQADDKLASIQKDWNTLKPQLQAEINALSTKVSGIDDKSNTIKARLDALVVQLDSIDIVSVKAVADKATADIATLTKSIDKKIDDIQVGGRNYIKNSDETVTINGDTDHFKIMYNSLTPEIWTYSAEVKYIRGQDTSVFLSVFSGNTEMGYNSVSVPIKDGKISWTFKPNSANGTALLMYAGAGSWETTPGKTLEVIKQKIEKGTIATDWSPAPEDISAEIDTKISKLTKSVNGITPDASGNISLPQPDLSPYATTVAMNTAITSAKTAMATDAQTKANTALANAKSYADTKKSEAQSYTDSKLSGVLKSWTGTQAQYDALATKDSNTLYIIVEVV